MAKTDKNAVTHGATDDEALRLDRQLCFPLYAASRKIVGLYTPVLKPLGITYTQYLVFLALWEHDGVPVGDLCRRLYLDNGTLTPLLKRMERDGYLTRTRSTTDERVVVVSLTKKGRELKERARGIPAQIGTCVNLPHDEAATLYKLLYELLLHDEHGTETVDPA